MQDSKAQRTKVHLRLFSNFTDIKSYQNNIKKSRLRRRKCTQHNKGA